MPNRKEAKLFPPLLFIKNGFQIEFRDGDYTLDLGQAHEPISFDTTSTDFVHCAIELVRLITEQVPSKLASKGEGSKELELYAWLYSCFMIGCSDKLDRAW